MSFSYLKRFVVCVWDCSSQSVTCIIKMNVFLSHLCYVGDESSFIFPENTVLFELMDGYYTTQATRQELVSGRQIIPMKMSEVRRDCQSRVSKVSFTLEDFLSICTKEKELRSRERYLASLSRALEEKLNQRKVYFQFLMKRNSLQDELEVLRNRVKLKRKENKKAKLRRDEQAKALKLSSEKLRQAEVALVAKRQHLEKEMEIKNQNLERLKQIIFYQKRNTLHLVHQLGEIYKIQKCIKGSVNGDKKTVWWTICEFFLPHSNFDGCNEDQIAAALGYVCHFLFMLAKYLDVPLRYPLIPKCSHSSITDPITNKGQYPLYSRGVASDRFQYAVFLLNKNIEQLIESQDLGIKVKNLRETLPNLYKLMLGLENRRKEYMKGTVQFPSITSTRPVKQASG
eukprot:TRINITY_DN3096_c0_g1_i4.p1 TRINITY_DN3096_c0_g1~~TRINITY_DN3096_c0_g1_i4.p1  ORF type:complete len:399 (+),score=85.31 TRINITY_DN3096_c0_g1_i4:803-1999(+)